MKVSINKAYVNIGIHEYMLVLLSECVVNWYTFETHNFSGFEMFI